MPKCPHIQSLYFYTVNTVQHCHCSNKKDDLILIQYYVMMLCDYNVLRCVTTIAKLV